MGERCPVFLYQKYVQHRPKCDLSHFYLRPLIKPTDDIWFACQPVGRQTLGKVIADACKNIGLGGFRSNHSLRATAATRLYDAEVDEQVIAEITGHRSSAIRGYKRTSDELKRKACEIVQGGSKLPKCTSITPLSDKSTNLNVNLNFQ